MTMTTSGHAHHPLDRRERIYRRLLVVYPRDFREQYGDDLAQTFRDLMVFSTGGRTVWWRTASDLMSSAARERWSTFSGGRKSSVGVMFVLAATVVASLVMGPSPSPLILVPTVVMIGLPIYGITRFRRAWLIRRTTGGAIATQVSIGLASFAPAAVILVLLGEDAGYLIFVSVALALIVGSALGLIWAVITLITSGRTSLAHRRWVRPVLVIVPCLAILGFIIGASYNSYRQSLGPPGDHSVENASSDTRAMWEAANVGDVDEVSHLAAETCADPWVKFDGHNAKGQAETRELELPDELEPPFREISDILGDYMDDWDDRCGRSD